MKMGKNEKRWDLSTKAFFRNLFLGILVVKAYCSSLAAAGSVVKSLPGFEGPLPFYLETGYIGVGESEKVQLFYYFIKSETINPEGAPLLLWLTGGPGCSALSGLVYEIGPFTIKAEEYVGRLPKLKLNPYSWTQVANIIFLDLPVGTGFSYATTVEASHSSDYQESDHAYEFLRKWLLEHPQFISNPFYVSGDSYSGITVPIITQLISNGNGFGFEPRIALKGYILGNPVTSPLDSNYRIPFVHGMALISDELYEALEETCKGEYQIIDPWNEACLKNVQKFNQLLSDIDKAQILEPNCPLANPNPNPNPNPNKSSSYEIFHRKLFHDDDALKTIPVSAFECRSDSYVLLYHWANDVTVQEALHVRKGTIKVWQRCNRSNLNFTRTVKDSRPYHASLSILGYRSLIYSGDHDYVVPFLATQAWIRDLNYRIIADWRPWLLQAQVAGYTRTYANQMTFATVKGGGHTAPEYKPFQCEAMFNRWISYQPL